MYYRLTYSRGDIHNCRGVLCSQRRLDIGQTPSCELLLPEREEFVPQMCASILPKSSSGWYLVRRTDYVDIRVNGQDVEAAIALNDGDKIVFDDGVHTTELLFSVSRDSDYDEASGVVYLHKSGIRRTMIVTSALAAVALAIAVVAILVNNDRQMLRYLDYDQYSASLYHVDTDSVFLSKDTVIDGQPQEILLEAIAMKQSRRGTCFLTQDGYFVTARHCLEPWLDDEDWDGISDEMSDELRLATTAETRNQENGEQTYKVWARCVVSRGEEQYVYRSTDFCMNRSRDMVLPLGTDEKPIYLRTIIPIAQRRDMELGDFAYIKAKPPLQGRFSMASSEELLFFDRQLDKDILVLGFPVDNSGGQNINKTDGNCQHLLFNSDSIPITCFQATADINPGNSGGPVLALIGGEVKVIGIVSKADQFAQHGTFWIVPVTEVQAMINQCDKTIEDTMQWIR